MTMVCQGCWELLPFTRVCLGEPLCCICAVVGANRAHDSSSTTVAPVSGVDELRKLIGTLSVKVTKVDVYATGTVAVVAFAQKGLACTARYDIDVKIAIVWLVQEYKLN